MRAAGGGLPDGRAAQTRKRAQGVNRYRCLPGTGERRECLFNKLLAYWRRRETFFVAGHLSEERIAYNNTLFYMPLTVSLTLRRATRLHQHLSHI